MKIVNSVFSILGILLLSGISSCTSDRPATNASLPPGPAGNCDRVCLENFADQYLAAMVDHDPAKAPLAENLIFTENTIKLPPTEGLWFTASGLGDFKFYICDPQEGQVAWTGVVMEHDQPVLMSVRLKIVNRRITEAESIVLRDVDENILANLNAPPPGFTETLPSGERFSREEMLRMPDIYFEALDKLDDSDVPWDEDAYRIENGMVTCGTIPNAAPPSERSLPNSPSCRAGKIPPSLKTIHSVYPRRTPVVDVERGLTWGLYCFNHRGLDEITMPDGKVYPSYSKKPNSMPFADMFKMKKGKLLGIFAIGTMLPYGTGDGWSGPMFD